MFLIICLILPTDDRVPTELKKCIMQARMDKKLTQSQLAQVILFLSLSHRQRDYGWQLVFLGPVWTDMTRNNMAQT